MMRKCIGVVILDDLQAETDESFQVSIEELGITTDVIIMNVDIGK